MFPSLFRKLHDFAALRFEHGARYSDFKIFSAAAVFQIAMVYDPHFARLLVLWWFAASDSGCLFFEISPPVSCRQRPVASGPLKRRTGLAEELEHKASRNLAEHR